MDVFSSEKRSWIMRQVRGRDTKPEILVRSIVHRLGYRFRLHRKDLPGCPDIVLPRHKKVIFVHGCFWHGHPQCKRSVRPTTNTDFWDKKLDLNIQRDERFQQELKEMGWGVLVVWQCETRDPENLIRKLERFLSDENEQNTAGT